MVLLIAIISLLSYYTIRKIYLNQLQSQIATNLKLVAAMIEVKYLPYLMSGSVENRGLKYYRERFVTITTRINNPDLLIFDQDLRIIIRADSAALKAMEEPDLRMHKRDILTMNRDGIFTTLPFKGKDSLWYMWGFYRLSDEYWLAIQENAARLNEIEFLAWIFAAIGGGGLVLVFAGSYLLARLIIQPVNLLAQFSEKIGNGQFQSQVPQHVRGEFNILANTLDRMRLQLIHHQSEKEEMLAQIAHEIRNPLGGMELLAGLIREDLQTDNKNITYIQKVLDEISGMKCLITAFLNYSRPMPAQPGNVNVYDTVEEVRQMMNIELQQKQIAYENYIDSSLMIDFDGNHFRQILLNLVTNSIQAMAESGKICFSAAKSNLNIQIRIADNGPGVPEPLLEKIFNPFFTTRIEGTGLGLSICKKLCFENQAAITIEKNPDGGSVFVITNNMTTGND